MSDVFQRQRGLVDQAKLSKLAILFANKAAFPQQFIQSFELIGQQLGVNQFCQNQQNVAEDTHDFSLIWSTTDNKSTASSVTKEIFICYGGDGIFLDGRNSVKPLPIVYHPAISIIAACLAWNEIIRRSECYLPVNIPKVTLSLNVRVDEPSMAGSIEDLKFALDGIETTNTIRDIDLNLGHKRVAMRLSDDNELVKQLIDKLQISGGDRNSKPKTPVVEFDLGKELETISGHVTVVGAGGLGTWVLHNLVNGVKNLQDSELSLLVIDKDMTIESHNLNRQVIFGLDDVGKPKIEATRDWLANELPSAKVSLAYELNDANVNYTEEEFDDDDDGFSLDDLNLGHESIVREYQVESDESIHHMLQETDAVIGCLDAMRPRVLADLVSARQNKPYINGGVKGLVAQYMEFSSTNLVETYGASVAKDTSVVSCQEDGDVPVSSIVLTNALVGAFQAISAIQRLSGMSCSSVSSVNWYARENEIFCNPSDFVVDRKSGVSEIAKALWPNQEKTEISGV